LSDLGTIFLLYNRPDSALTFLHRAQDIDDRDPITNLNVAVALTEQGNYAEALQVLKKVVHSEPRMAIAHFYIAKIYYLQKQYDRAEESARQAVDTAPDLLDAWLLLVNARVEQKKNDQAREALTHVRESIHDGIVTRIIDEQLSALGN
jgi:tetratricopeptide (TPR) repeat protein